MGEYEGEIYTDELMQDLEGVEDAIDIELNTHIVKMTSKEYPYHEVEVPEDFIEEFKDTIVLVKKVLTVTVLADMIKLNTDFYNPDDVLIFIVDACESLDFEINKHILEIEPPSDGTSVLNVNGEFLRASELVALIAKAMLIKNIGNKALKSFGNYEL